MAFEVINPHGLDWDTPTKKVNKGLKALKRDKEAWIRAIPPSPAHGSGTLQQRLWRLVSDYVRIRDWHQFEGKCIATGKYIPHWTQGNAGHFKAYSRCNGIYKFDVRNIHLQAASSNVWGTMDDWFSYAEELEKRHGITKVMIDAENQQTSLKSLSTENILNQMKRLLADMGDLKEQPDYYQRASTLLAELHKLPQ